jgi:hypothetical protein
MIVKTVQADDNCLIRRLLLHCVTWGIYLSGYIKLRVFITQIIAILIGNSGCPHFIAV